MRKVYKPNYSATQKAIQQEKGNNIIVGSATVPAMPCGKKWVLPGGSVTTSRIRATEVAREINRLMKLARA